MSNLMKNERYNIIRVSVNIATNECLTTDELLGQIAQELDELKSGDSGIDNDAIVPFLLGTDDTYTEIDVGTGMESPIDAVKAALSVGDEDKLYSAEHIMVCVNGDFGLSQLSEVQEYFDKWGDDVNIVFSAKRPDMAADMCSAMILVSGARDKMKEEVWDAMNAPV